MKTNRLLKEIMFIIIHVMPVIYLVMIYDALPAEIPMHFNLEGEPDSYSSKDKLYWLVGLMNGLGYILFLVIPFIDPKKFAEEHAKIYFRLRVGLTIIFAGLSAIGVYLAYGDVHTGLQMMGLLLALICLFLGNYMQAVRTNYFIGIRTPWTLSSETVWKKTHLLTGRMYFYGGLASLPVIFFVSFNLAPFAPALVLVAASLFGLIYSFVLYKKEKSTGK
ncbi:MAG: SdpI family protein [Crocinitomicaceae bacterium]|nr:SdpI family protein [Crocinitomicaceae bacterium]MBK8926797.1 SdpI family protein [Crocinitomicaceae bacterium]